MDDLLALIHQTDPSVRLNYNRAVCRFSERHATLRTTCIVRAQEEAIELSQIKTPTEPIHMTLGSMTQG